MFFKVTFIQQGICSYTVKAITISILTQENHTWLINVLQKQQFIDEMRKVYEAILQYSGHVVIGLLCIISGSRF